MSEYADECCVVHRHKICRARKEHTCSACRATIRPGDYYASVFALSNACGPENFRRCGACERTWQHLMGKCAEHNRLNNDSLFPLEDLSCGKAYTEEWGDVPDEIAALPLLSADERGALLKP